MNMKRNRLYRTTIAAIATTALTAGLSAVAMAGDSGKKNSWEGEMSDAWIDGKIEASYSLNRYLSPFAIDTDVEQGIVFLTGEVDSKIDKELAEEIAQSIEGVHEVKNELRVVERNKPSETDGTLDNLADEFGTQINDATTTARVKYALLANDSTGGLSINVDTVDGKVTLTGDVSSAQESELAERLAENAEGVVEVENHLKVKEQS